MYLIFDTETTGLPKNFNARYTDTDNWPRMVQLAWQEYDKDGNLLKEFDLSHLSTGFYHCEIRVDSYTINGLREIKKFEQKIRVRESRSARKKNRKK